jgi:hypothetical protein
MFAAVFSSAFLARTLYDWLVPTSYFAVRATVSTWSGVMILFVVAFWAAWRSRSFIAGPVTAAVTSQLAALISVVGTVILLAIWHDPGTQEAIAGSGGLAEVFVLPFMMIIPGLIVGSIGAAAAILGRRLLRAA